MNDTTAAVAEGSEYPRQRPMIVTSYGRGRLNALDQEQAEHLEHQDAAEEREQVAPAPERHRRDEQRDRDEEHRPAGGDAVDPAGDVDQPIGPQAGDRAQDGSVDAIGEAAHAW